MNSCLTEWLLPQRAIHQPPDKLALLDANRTPPVQWTFAQLTSHLQSPSLQLHLQTSQPLQTSPAQTVCVCMENSLEMAWTLLWLWQSPLNAIAPLNPRWRMDEHVWYLKQLRPRWLMLPSLSPQTEKRGIRIEDWLKMIKEHVHWEMKVFVVEWVSKEERMQVRLVSEVQQRKIIQEISRQGNEMKKNQEKIEGREDQLPHDTVLLLFTSGTTSDPKCVPLSKSNLIRSIANISSSYALSPVDSTVVMMPLFHVHGLIGSFLSTLATGGTSIVLLFSIQRWIQLQAMSNSGSSSVTNATSTTVTSTKNSILSRCTWFSAVPTMHQLIINHPDFKADCMPHLKFIRSCSSPLSVNLWRRLHDLWFIPVLQAYAMTECTHQISTHRCQKFFSQSEQPKKTEIKKEWKERMKDGSVGQAQGVSILLVHPDTHQPDLTTSIATIGEICVRGPSVFQGYWHPDPHKRLQLHQESFYPGGWLRTGDLGKRDSQTGDLLIIGRLKEMINRGGEKIHPQHIDDRIQPILFKSQLVSECMCIGVPHAVYGEEVELVVVWKRAPRDQKQVRQWSDTVLALCKQNLAWFECPKRVRVLETLPRTTTGKVQRRRVAATVLQKDQDERGKQAKL